MKKLILVLLSAAILVSLCACGERCYVCEKGRATKTWVGYDVCQDCYSELSSDYYRRQREKEEAEAAARQKGEQSLKVKATSLTSNNTYMIFEGTVTNNGSDTYYFVKVKIVYKDSSGNVIDTDTAYACGDEGIAPGETVKFTGYVDKDSRIETASASIYDFDYD